MGASESKKKFEVKNGKELKKEISLRGEICSSWGYNYKAEIMQDFCRFLSENGFTVNLHLVPKSGGNGENYLFQQLENDKLVQIFSNNRSLHPNAVNSFSMSSKYFSNYMEKIQI